MGTLPQGYSGILSMEPERDEHFELNKKLDRVGEYKFTKHHRKEPIKPSVLDGGSGEELLLLGILIFLYVGSEHTKEDLILMGVVAYLLFGTEDHTGSDNL